MSLPEEQQSKTGGNITLIVLSVALGFAVVYHADKYAETHQEDPPTTYNELGIECTPNK